jgi:diaminopimelate epimerase
MKLRFSKMHGLGNDFVVIDAINQSIAMTPSLARQLADRHFGIGCDQILLVERPTQARVDFRYRIFNADGSEVEQCGNGARCFVRFVHEQGLTDKTELRVETHSGIITLRREENGEISVDLGVPHFLPEEIPFSTELGDLPLQPLEIGEKTCEISVVSMGNPHAVQLCDDIDRAPVATLGPLIESHPRFPRRVNAGFMQVTGRHAIRLRVFERGAGETLACGSGACAAAVAGMRLGLLDSPVRVSMRGGDLLITWHGEDSSVIMTGPSQTVFTGTIEIPD